MNITFCDNTGNNVVSNVSLDFISHIEKLHQTSAEVLISNEGLALSSMRRRQAVLSRCLVALRTQSLVKALVVKE